MRMKQFTAIILMLGLGLSFQVKADWKRAHYYERSANSEIYLSAAMNAFTAANTELEGLGKPPLYCQPVSVNLKAEDAVSIFEQERLFRMSTGSRNTPFWKEITLEYVLLWGLQRAYPCDESS